MEEYRQIFSNKLNNHREATENYDLDVIVVKALIR